MREGEGRVIIEWVHRKLGHERCPFVDGDDKPCRKWVAPTGGARAGMNVHMLNKHYMSIYEWETLAKARMNAHHHLVCATCHAQQHAHAHHGTPSPPPATFDEADFAGKLSAAMMSHDLILPETILAPKMTEDDMRRAALDLVASRNRLRSHG